MTPISWAIIAAAIVIGAVVVSVVAAGVAVTAIWAAWILGFGLLAAGEELWSRRQKHQQRQRNAKTAEGVRRTAAEEWEVRQSKSQGTSTPSRSVSHTSTPEGSETSSELRLSLLSPTQYKQGAHNYGFRRIAGQEVRQIQDNTAPPHPPPASLPLTPLTPQEQQAYEETLEIIGEDEFFAQIREQPEGAKPLHIPSVAELVARQRDTDRARQNILQPKPIGKFTAQLQEERAQPKERQV